MAVFQWRRQGGDAAMTKRLSVAPAPGPLENFAEGFDDLFGARAQREGFRRYLEGLLLPPIAMTKTTTVPWANSLTTQWLRC
jgi:hypothetical protein